jgi:hypothetical protein
MASSVVLALLETALMCLFTRWFRREDLPALAAPIKDIESDRAPCGLSSHGKVSYARAWSGMRSYGVRFLGGILYETMLVSWSCSLRGCWIGFKTSSSLFPYGLVTSVLYSFIPSSILLSVWRRLPWPTVYLCFARLYCCKRFVVENLRTDCKVNAILLINFTF